MTPFYLKNLTKTLSKEFGFKGVNIRTIIRDKERRLVHSHKPGFEIKK